MRVLWGKNKWIKIRIYHDPFERISLARVSTRLLISPGFCATPFFIFSPELKVAIKMKFFVQHTHAPPRSWVKLYLPSSDKVFLCSLGYWARSQSEHYSIFGCRVWSLLYSCRFLHLPMLPEGWGAHRLKFYSFCSGPSRPRSRSHI